MHNTDILFNKYKNIDEELKKESNNYEHKIKNYVYNNATKCLSLYLISLEIILLIVCFNSQANTRTVLISACAMVICGILYLFFDKICSNDTILYHNNVSQYKAFSTIKDYSLDTTNLISLLKNYEAQIIKDLLNNNVKLYFIEDLKENLDTLYLKTEFEISDDNLKLIFNRGTTLLTVDETFKFLEDFINKYNKEYDLYQNKNLKLSELEKVITQNKLNEELYDKLSKQE